MHFTKVLSGGIQANTLPSGAKTITYADEPGEDFLPIRRVAILIQQKLTTALLWVIREPDAPPLWASISHTADNVLNEAFRQGVLKGDKPQTAYFVKCDATTMTQSDIDNGIVNLVVGFAPVAPAEFYVITLPLHASPTRPPK